MRELEGRSYQEISGVLGVSVSAVEALLFRARRNLQVRRGALGVLTTVPLPGSLASFIGGGGGAAVAGSTVFGADLDAQGGSRRRRGCGDRRRRLRGRQVGAGYACRNAGGVRRAEGRVHVSADGTDPATPASDRGARPAGEAAARSRHVAQRPQSHDRPGPRARSRRRSSRRHRSRHRRRRQQSPHRPCRSPCRSCRRCRRCLRSIPPPPPLPPLPVLPPPPPLPPLPPLPPIK